MTAVPRPDGDVDAGEASERLLRELNLAQGAAEQPQTGPGDRARVAGNRLEGIALGVDRLNIGCEIQHQLRAKLNATIELARVLISQVRALPER